MDWELHILTECHIDLLLVETILPPKNKYNKQKNCVEVFNVFENKKRNLYNKPVFGIIDNDKNKPKGFYSFKEKHTHSDTLSIYKNDNFQYIITVGSENKAIEDFILKNSEKCNISLSDYDLPTDLKSLSNITKYIHSKKEENNSNIANLKRLFKNIKQNENSDFYKLAQWIEFFKTNPYNLDINLL